jgi:hypothetical protein
MVEDEVDIISLSLGGLAQLVTYDHDTIPIGAYNTIKKGVLVVVVVGNRGRVYSSIENNAPWIMTVGADKQVRSIKTKLLSEDPAPILGESTGGDWGSFGTRPASVDWSPLLYDQQGNKRY